MAVIKPFACVRPAPAMAGETAALPYDVYDRGEAKAEVTRHPHSFLAIARAEVHFADSVDPGAPCVYAEAKRRLQEEIAGGVYVEDEERSLYFYELTMDGHVQTGIVACASVDDYMGGVIKKHENTREGMERDRVRHIDVLNAQTGPIFLTFRPNEQVRALTESAKAKKPLYDIVTDDGIRHRVWKAGREQSEEICRLFADVPSLYIADGHHRAAAAVKVAGKRRAEHPEAGPEAEFNYFLSVLFPADELQILPYNRVVRDLNGYLAGEFIEAVSNFFDVREAGVEPFAPDRKGHFGMYLEKRWYELTAKPDLIPDDPVGALDVSVLQDRLFAPILGIQDPRTDSRIDFVGGIRGLEELERRADSGWKAAFSLYPTSMEEFLAVADAGRLMPPKSTWFEPKLRSGFFIHRLG